jgi:hypothetical protein
MTAGAILSGSDSIGAALPRVTDWEVRLAAHGEAMRAARYRLGRLDCARAAVLAVEAVTGVDIWPPALSGYGTPRGMVRAMRRLGWSSLDDAATALLGSAIPALAAHSGDVVSDGQALGWMTANGPLALSENGLVGMGVILRAWPAGRANG